MEVNSLISYNNVQYLHASLSFHQAFDGCSQEYILHQLNFLERKGGYSRLINMPYLSSLSLPLIGIQWSMEDDLNHNLMPQLSHKDMIVLSVKVLLNFGPTVPSDPHPPKQMITVGTCNSSKIKKRI